MEENTECFCGYKKESYGVLIMVALVVIILWWTW